MYNSSKKEKLFENLKTKWVTEILHKQDKLLVAEKQIQDMENEINNIRKMQKVNDSDSETKGATNKTKPLLTNEDDKLMKEIESLRKIVNQMSPGHDKYNDMVQNLMKKESEYESALIDCESEEIQRGKNPLYDIYDYEIFENGESEYIGDFSSIIFKENSEVNGEKMDFLYD